ncbi:MAG: 7TM-DISM domain-containing protein, partial [Pseudomonadota bacterium]|nr:7TM-DISM domain-containing protein [Pseudomonadota bacterium]
MRQRFEWAPAAASHWLLALVLLMTALAPGPAGAADTCREGEVVLDDRIGSIRNLGGCIWFLEDPAQTLTLEQVRSLGEQAFTLHEGGVLNFGYTESAYWVRVDLRAAPGLNQSNWILELALPLVDEVALYMVRDNSLVEVRRAGYEDNWADRDLAVPNPTFRLAIEPGTLNRLYLRVTNTNTFRLPISLWHPDSYIEKVSVDELVRGILLGAVLAILAYNLFVAVSVRERSNIYYVLYLVSATVFIFTEQVH